MIRPLLLSLFWSALAGSVAAQEAPRVKAGCDYDALALTNTMLRRSRAMRFRATTTNGDLKGGFTGFVCEHDRDGTEPDKAMRLMLSDVKKLEVGRTTVAGWKGALIGAALGAAFGAVIRSEADDSARSAIMGLVVGGFSGATFLRTEWVPIPLPSPSPRVEN